jgi:hypothetical protein
LDERAAAMIVEIVIGDAKVSQHAHAAPGVVHHRYSFSRRSLCGRPTEVRLCGRSVCRRAESPRLPLHTVRERWARAWSTGYTSLTSPGRCVRLASSLDTSEILVCSSFLQRRKSSFHLLVAARHQNFGQSAHSCSATGTQVESLCPANRRKLVASISRKWSDNVRFPKLYLADY